MNAVFGIVFILLLFFIAISRCSLLTICLQDVLLHHLAALLHLVGLLRHLVDHLTNQSW